MEVRRAHLAHGRCGALRWCGAAFRATPARGARWQEDTQPLARSQGRRQARSQGMGAAGRWTDHPLSSPMSKDTSTLAPDAADFAPGLLSIQEAPPSRLPRVVLWLVISLVGALLLWAIFGKLDIIASAEGRLVPQTYVKIVQPADAGIVQEILVREGEPVRAGQALMRMDMKLAEADAATLQNEIAVKSLTLRRVDAEIAGAPLLRKADDPPQLFLQIDAQYRAHRQAYLDAIAQEQEALNKARHDLGGAEQALHKLEQTVPIYQRTAASYEKL